MEPTYPLCACVCTTNACIFGCTISPLPTPFTHLLIGWEGEGRVKGKQYCVMLWPFLFICFVLCSVCQALCSAPCIAFLSSMTAIMTTRKWADKRLSRPWFRHRRRRWGGPSIVWTLGPSEGLAADLISMFVCLLLLYCSWGGRGWDY